MNYFLAYIYYADYVITDSFHATAFSVIFEKQFGVVLKKQYQALNGRLISILDTLNLRDRVVYDIDVLDTRIIYESIKFRIEDEKKKATSYVEALENEI